MRACQQAPAERTEQELAREWGSREVKPRQRAIGLSIQILISSLPWTSQSFALKDYTSFVRIWQDATSPCDLLQGLVAGTSPIVCADLNRRPQNTFFCRQRRVTLSTETNLKCKRVLHFFSVSKLCKECEILLSSWASLGQNTGTWVEGREHDVTDTSRGTEIIIVESRAQVSRDGHGETTKLR